MGQLYTAESSSPEETEAVLYLLVLGCCSCCVGAVCHGVCAYDVCWVAYDPSVVQEVVFRAQKIG